MIKSVVQLKAFARQDGAFLSLLWIASFASLVLMPGLPLGNILALATPLFVGWRLAKFRDYALEGVISLRRGYAYSVYTFFYASAIFALAQYVYFKFLDGGVFERMLTETMQTVAPIYVRSGISQKELTDSINAITVMTPVQWAFVFMMQNLFIGAVVGLPIAAVCARRVGRGNRNASYGSNRLGNNSGQ